MTGYNESDNLNFPNRSSRVNYAPRQVHNTNHATPQRPAPRKAVNSKAPKSKRRSNPTLVAILIVLLITVILFALAMVGMYAQNEVSKVIPYVSVEAGTSVGYEMFFEEPIDNPSLVTTNLDLSTIDTSTPKRVEFMIKVWRFKIPCVLEVKDTTAPICTPIVQTLFTTSEIPSAEDCVTDVFDMAPVTVSYSGEPDISRQGDFTYYVNVEDAYGNITLVEVPFHVVDDKIAPEITGTHNITGYAGDTIAYRKGVTVTDNYDTDVELVVDSSGVNLNTPGTYTATYTATDSAGNTTSTSITVTLKKKPATYVDPDTVYAEAQKVLDQITTPGMSDMEVALQIFWWTRYHINYIDHTDTTSWTRAAYDALTKHQGTCYSFAYAAKALLDQAGIENRIVRREPYRWSKHFWNMIKIDGQWYHCDSTPRLEYHSYLFMYTDRELANFYVHNYNGYSYDHNKHPASATQSVQSRIDYVNHRIR